MISNLNQVETIIIKKVISDYEDGMPINNVAGKYTLERNVVLAILNERVRVKDLPNARIRGTSFIVIGDTHFGSELEKIIYLEYVYDYARKNGIKSIIHAGDLIQSTMRPVMNKYVNQSKQINHLVDDYPYDETITNYILFGNHDFHTLYKEDYYLKVIKKRKDFNLLGFKRAYLSWQKFLICVDHPIDKYKINIPNVNPLMRFIGHSHDFHISSPNNIYTPPLSLDQKYHNYGIPWPGFIVVNRNGDNADIYLLTFNEYVKDYRDAKAISKIRKSTPEVHNYGVVRSLKMRDNMTIGKR